MSVPYALKAADAETLGGLPASAYALAQTNAPAGSGVSGASESTGTSAAGSAATPQGTTAKSATTAKPQAAGAIATNFVPVFTNSAGALGSSVLFQNATSNFLGLGTMSPLTSLDLRLTGAGSGGVVSVGSQNYGRFGVLGISTGAGLPFMVEGDASDDLVLGANLTEYMRITSVGNVGIGTSRPVSPLDLRFTGAAAGNLVSLGNQTQGRFGILGFSNGAGLPFIVEGDTNDDLVLGANATERMRFTSAGNVGIGTATPRNYAFLNVVNPNPSHYAIYAETSPGSGGGASAIYGISFPTMGIGVLGQSGNLSPGFITFNIGVAGQTNDGIGVEGSVGAMGGVAVSGRVGDNSATLFNGVNASHATVFRIDSTGKGFFDGGTQTGGADFAESIAVRSERGSYEPGDVLVIDVSGRRRLTVSRRPYSRRVAGIYSTKPGVLATPYSMNDPRGGEEVPLAIVGIVPCKVSTENGPISVGDLLVTSGTPGRAMKGTDRSRMLGAVLGKALEPLHEGTGVIQVLVSLE